MEVTRYCHTEAITVDISEDADLSTAFDARPGFRYGLVIPSNFDGTQIIFHGSYDDDTYYPIYGDTGTQAAMTVAASRSYTLPTSLAVWPFIKIETVTDQTTSDTVFYIVAKG